MEIARSDSPGHFSGAHFPEGHPDPAEIQAALVRFAAKCEFDAGTGCVLWTGGRTAGGGHSRPYGAFKFQGRRWFAHRWAARFIHGLAIDGLQVDHCCPAHVRPLPDTLCVQHLQALPLALNRTLQTTRAREVQTIEQRRFWAHVRCGLEPEPPRPSDELGAAVPFFVAPVWLQLARGAGAAL